MKVSAQIVNVEEFQAYAEQRNNVVIMGTTRVTFSGERSGFYVQLSEPVYASILDKIEAGAPPTVSMEIWAKPYTNKQTGEQRATLAGKIEQVI